MLATVAVALGLAVATQAAASEREDDERPTWRFRDETRPVKAVVIAGSIGAWQRRPYAKEIERQCSNVEIVNLSKAGLGAWALKKRFDEQVLDNRRIDPDADGQEHWLIYGGGLNTVWDPYRNNHHAKNTFVKAHMAGFKVLALSPTPWGSDDDRRFDGARALRSRKATQQIVDFTLRRLSPSDALGSYAERRPAGVDGPWDPLEIPDLAVDLYDSPLRDGTASISEVDVSREVLGKDRAWRRAHRDDDTEVRELALQEDAKMLAEVPRWYLRRELHAFDHIHPNEDGHRVIASIACPRLPESWGCNCDAAPSHAASGAQSATQTPAQPPGARDADMVAGPTPPG